jgi:uncharacterized protein (DUF58 family)
MVFLAGCGKFCKFSINCPWLAKGNAMRPIAATKPDDHLSNHAHGLIRDARDLAARLPQLMLAARKVSSSVAHGLHGRRRSGMGENFWQFRHFGAGESAARIDWRRSARDNHLYVREREWESARTVWLWIDRSRSMGYQSHHVPHSKLERAVVLALSLADLLVQGGERVGLLGLGRPTARRNAVEVLGQVLAQHAFYDDTPLIAAQATPLSDVIVLSDFLHGEAEHLALLKSISARNARGHAITLIDPAEEDFPFEGRTEFSDPENGDRLVFGRAQNVQQDYRRYFKAHRAAQQEAARRLGWTSQSHRTDHPAQEVVLMLHRLLAERSFT